MKNVLITGCSSGLGLALSKLYLKKGYRVYGISRNKPSLENKNFVFKSCNLSKITKIKKELKKYLKKIERFEHVYLNAGTLGEINSMTKLKTKQIKKTLDINLFSNKELLDILTLLKVKNIVAISSGASINGSFGWGGYSLSKASLNMLINLYAKEMPKTKLLAIAPGVIETPMTDIIRFKIDDTIFTSAKTLKEAVIQKPKEAAFKLVNVHKRFKEFESGSFIDIRRI